MIRTFFSIIFGFLILFLISFIIELIPLSFFGQKIINGAKKHNIDIEITSSCSFQLLNLSSSIHSFNYSLSLEGNQISGRGENLSYGLVTDNIDVENLYIDITLSRNNKTEDIYNQISTFIEKKFYSIKVKNLFVSVYKKPNKQEEQISDNLLIKELLLSNVQVKKDKKEIKYITNANISKEKQISFSFISKNKDKDNYENNIKIQTDNFNCYVYNTNNNGNIDCKTNNLLSLLKDAGLVIKDNFYQKVLNKKINIQAEINHKIKNDTTVNGDIIVNNNKGKIAYDNNLLKISFKELNLDSLSEETKSNFEEEKNDAINAIAMSGNNNEVMKKINKEQKLLNINSFKELTLILLELIKDYKQQLLLKIETGKINDTAFGDVLLDLLKENNYEIRIKSASMLFGNRLQDKLSIHYAQDQIGNLIISGENINSFIKIFNIKMLKQNLISNKYYIGGDVKFYVNELNFDSISILKDDNQILNYSFNSKYNFEKKQVKKQTLLKIQDVSINDIFNIDTIIQDGYDWFLSFQKNTKQDAIFWKKLFAKHSDEKEGDIIKKQIAINNSAYLGEKINSCIIEYNDKKTSTKLDFNIKSDYANLDSNFVVKNVDGKETLEANIDAENINIQKINVINEYLKNIIGFQLYEIFMQDKEYNIPSLVGIYGNIMLNLDSVLLNNGKTIRNFNGNLSVNNGIITGNNIKFQYENGNIDSNIYFSLQGIPQMHIGLACAGIELSDIITSPINGYLSLQADIKANGFNPVSFFGNNLNIISKFVIQNLQIPNFDILNMSKHIIANGIQNNFNYNNIVNSNNLFFEESNGEFILEQNIVNGKINMSRELVSGSAEFNYDVEQSKVNKLTGSFVAMVLRQKFETPFPIYLPFACNGYINDIDCLVNWEQLQELIKIKK